MCSTFDVEVKQLHGAVLAYKHGGSTPVHRTTLHPTFFCATQLVPFKKWVVDSRDYDTHHYPGACYLSHPYVCIVLWMAKKVYDTATSCGFLSRSACVIMSGLDAIARRLVHALGTSPHYAITFMSGQRHFAVCTDDIAFLARCIDSFDLSSALPLVSSVDVLTSCEDM